MNPKRNKSVADSWVALPYCAGSDGHQKYPDGGRILEARENSLSLGRVTAAINSAEDDPILAEEATHEVQALLPVGKDYT